jgi:hypothetical protein
MDRFRATVSRAMAGFLIVSVPRSYERTQSFLDMSFLK